jgi:SSS family solute:Na+ symporter/sodium/pantothenate symporter
MSGSPWAWGLFAVYLGVTSWLAWRGGRRSGGDARGFAIGSGAMSPWVAGMTLGACLASSATFVLFPGFVYADGLPALIGFTLPLVAGIAVGLLVLGPRFQEIGARSGALTLPHWLGARYDSPLLRRTFSALNVLNVAYLVLITVGCGYVMERALGLPYAWSVVGIVAFVFAYTGLGGAWAHAFTNTLQGAVMLVVAVVVFASGLGIWADGTVGAALASSGWTAPGSPLFSTAWEVWLVPFVMGAALSSQPHLLTKALYVADRRALAQTTAIGTVTFAVFSLVLFAGVYARVGLPAGVPQDQVMAEFLLVAFPWEPLGALVSVAILAASMSTMDGLLVAISASVAGDLLPGRGGVGLNRLVLLALAGATLAMALTPPKLVLILGQLGVYGLVAAGAGPLLAGLFLRGPLRAGPALASAAAALAVHFSLALGGLTPNPGVSAALALAVGVPIAMGGARIGAWRARRAERAAPATG